MFSRGWQVIQQQIQMRAQDRGICPWCGITSAMPPGPEVLYKTPEGITCQVKGRL